ncbi:MAG: HD domain-containing protein [Bacteroidales bacterium]|nr:HD domain-containing protein [Bacteroidales bacterium]
MNKNKIVNDPVWGFIQLPSDLAYDIVSHPYFQRLRRIVQMGLSFLVYPGAVHTRFNHSLGCLHLMKEALDMLQAKGVSITPEEKDAACAAILLHDIGHGPLSHVLEHTLLPSVSHEEVSQLIMQRLNRAWDGRLDMAMAIFNGHYPKPFLHQLVSGQLDVDRLDYLNRDSFYTGVQEGVVGTERIIKMMNVHEGQLVVEEKSIYSLEKFILSRRMMFWQVYLHKTSVCAELMLGHTLDRARFLLHENEALAGSPALLQLLKRPADQPADDSLLEPFSAIDDSDIWFSLKAWTQSRDTVLRTLSQRLLDRRLFKSELRNAPFEPAYIERVKAETLQKIGQADWLPYFFYEKGLSTKTYKYDTKEDDGIRVWRKDGQVVDLTTVSELLDRHFVMKADEKHLLCHA